jgi:hypothetical protein
MAYKINGKNRAIERLMVRGPKAPARLKYMHVSPKGTTVITPFSIARVSLPETTYHASAHAITQKQLDEIPRTTSSDPTLTVLPEGEVAVDSPAHMVPVNLNSLFDDFPCTESFVVNADILRKILTVASEVTNDANATTRLRYDRTTNTLRVDSFRMPGEQEFVCLMKCMKYTGNYLPGDVQPVKEMAKAEQQNLVMQLEAGRKFRGEGE